MKQSELIELIQAPQRSRAEDVGRLKSLKNEFPFFQSAHLLLTLASQKHDSSLFQQTLKTTAITIPNRSRLYFLLNAPEEKTEEVKVAEVAKPVEETKVAETKVAEEVKPVIEVKPATETKAVEEKKATVGEETTAETGKAEEKREEGGTAEIDHLKAIELAADNTATPEEELNAQVEKELQKGVVNAFVEKEILKTPELHREEEKKEAGSFTDWLKLLKKEQQSGTLSKPSPEPKTKKPLKPAEKPDKKTEQQSIIDKVIELNPGNIRLNPNQKFFAADNKAKESLLESEDLVTETLAKIYALQGNISKAVRAYEILSLKFPQKSAYFATLIENLKKGN